MNDNQTQWMRNAVGPAVFAIGALAVVLVLMILIKGMPTQDAKAMDALARGLVGFLGEMPLALTGVGLAFFGARLFVVGADERLGKNLAGVVLTGMGFAIFLSAILPNAGGAFGESIGGRVRDSHLGMSAFLSFIVGVVALAAPIWFLFVRERALALLETPVAVTETRREVAVHEAGGLSREEADALLPEPVSESESDSKSQELVQLLATQKDKLPEWLEESGYPQAPSPYGEDVRQQGGIPEGAVPLDTGTIPTDDTSQSTPQPSSVQRWTPTSLRHADDSAGEDLVEAEPTVDEPETVLEQREELAEELEPVAEELTVAESPELETVEPETVEITEPEPEPEPIAELTTPEPIVETPEPVATEPEPVVKPLAQPLEPASRPTPSWEQSNLFDDMTETEVEDEEEVEELVPQDAQAEIVEAEHDEELEDDEEWEYVEEEEDELDPAAEYEEEEEDEEEEWEEEPDEEAAEYEEEEYEEEEYEEGEEELDPAAEYEDEEEYEEEEEYEDEEAAEYEEEEEPETLEEAAELEEEPVAEEREVVLTPQAPPVATIEPEPTPTPEPAQESGRVTTDVVYQAGELFLDRGRVAVSMLQREFNLDFDESCEVMDRLQEMGLIGPYVGGHRRDILMTKDQWLERATAP